MGRTRWEGTTFAVLDRMSALGTGQEGDQTIVGMAA